MTKKKPCAKKSCGKSCKKKSCEVKKNNKQVIENTIPEPSPIIIETKNPSRLGIFWNYLKQKLGL